MTGIRRWLHGKRRFGRLLSSLGIAAISGFYVNLLSTSVAENGTFWNAAKDLGKWNMLPAFLLLVLVLDFLLQSRSAMSSSEHTDQIVQEVLAAATQSIVWPNTSRRVRAIVTVREGLTDQRVTMFSYNSNPDPERLARFPMNFGVTGRAIQTRSVVLEELSDNHIDDYPPEIQPLIAADVKTVLAAPLVDPSSRDTPAFGVLAFDSPLAAATLGFNRKGIKDCAQAWADIIAHLLIMKGYDKWGS